METSIKTYDAMGTPRFSITQSDHPAPRGQANRPPPQNLALKNGALTISVPPQGLVLIKLSTRTPTH